MSVKAKPDGYHTVTPYLVVEAVDRLIEFTKEVFGGEVTECIEGPGNQIMHAEVKIGDSIVMMGSAREGNPALSAMIYVYVDDIDGRVGRVNRY